MFTLIRRSVARKNQANTLEVVINHRGVKCGQNNVCLDFFFIIVYISRAVFCRSFSKFELQSYLNNVNIQKYREPITRLRLSSHRLHIETGRWSNTPREDRKCTLCNKLEDEFHLLFECKAYDDIRVKYIKRYYRDTLNMIKTTELMLSEHVKTQRNLAAFIYHAFEIKKTITQS